MCCPTTSTLFSILSQHFRTITSLNAFICVCLFLSLRRPHCPVTAVQSTLLSAKEQQEKGRAQGLRRNPFIAAEQALNGSLNKETQPIPRVVEVIQAQEEGIPFEKRPARVPDPLYIVTYGHTKKRTAISVEPKPSESLSNQPTALQITPYYRGGQ